jgi:hypothetical protein
MASGVKWMISRLIRDPLIHFLTIGLALFLAYGWLTPDEIAEDEILISESALLEFIQFRSRQFDEDRAREKLATMPDDERQRMVEDYIREEALYREALALGLNEGDYILKRRLVQKMEYLLSGSTAEDAVPEEAILEAYLAQHAPRYAKPTRHTFTHIFFSQETHGEQAKGLAADLLSKFSEDQPSFNEAGEYGDLFPYHRNYVDRPADYVASQFGSDWPDFLDQAPLDKWVGPVRSKLGQHLILITGRNAASVPSLDDIRPVLTRDYLAERRALQQQQATRALIDRYTIQYDGVSP